MKAALIVPTRNKNKPIPGVDGLSRIERCARSVLGQTMAGDLCIRFFDQGSTDGTFELLDRLCTEAMIKGLDAHVLRCPENPKHHAGTNASINADFDWAIKQTSADVIMVTCGDDWAHPERAAKVLEAFERTGAAWVGTTQEVEREGKVVMRSYFPDCGTRWISPAEAIEHQIGSSGSMAWTRKLYDKHGPMAGIESNDVILPIMALFEGGMYFIDEPLHTYVQHDDLGNLGMEGKLRAARGDAERLQLGEINIFHNAFNWSRVYQRLGNAGHFNKLSPEAQGALMRKVLGTGFGWANAREALILAGIEPINFKTKAPDA